MTVPSHPINQTRRKAPRRKVWALDPEGSLSGNERHKKRKRATFQPLKFYERNSLKKRQTNSERKINRQTIIENWDFAFNFIWELPLKRKTSKLEHSPSIWHNKIPLEPNRTKKKFHQKIEIVFNFIWEIPLKMNRTKILYRVPFNLRNPFKSKSPSI